MSRQAALGSGHVREAAVRPSGFFVLRTPLLPFSDITAWGSHLEARAHLDDGTLDEAIERDRTILRRRLEGVVTTPAFRDALFVASPSLEAAVDTWRKEPDSDRGRAAEQALLASFLRASAFPTPFGLFAGCSTGEIDGESHLRLGGRDGYRRSTRLDMDYLWGLAAALEHDRALRDGLVFRPNSSLYEVGERLLFAEARGDGAGRTYQLVAVEKTPYLLATLERARAGARLDDLVAALLDDDVTRADAEEYVDELVDGQLLVSDARPQLTGPPPTESLASVLASTSATAGPAGALQRAASALGAIDRDGVGSTPERYRQAAAPLEELPPVPDLGRFVQVDLLKPASGLTLGADVVSDLLAGVEALHAFSRYRPDEGLRRFREQFVERYETREVPLAEVLDEEHGIGFETPHAGSATAPLLAGLGLDGHEQHADRWTERDAHLLRRLTGALAAGDREISLEPEDVEAVRPSDAPPLPDAFEVLAELTAPSEEALRAGDREIVVHSASGPSGARLLGRFCHADERLHRLARDHLRAEEAVRPDVVFAEVVHLPEGRVGNILSRPVLRAYEIPYLGRSGAPEERQLALSDLLVSVTGDRIVLRSGRLGREVTPRLTTAHQYRRGLPAYRFLCALQTQGVNPGVTWEWGPLGRAPFLPRVVCGRVVLARARWTLGERELATFAEPDVARRFDAVQRLRERLALPRFVALADADNELLVDLDNVLTLDSLAHQLRGRALAGLVEATPPERLCVSGPEGPFTNQILVPFVRATEAGPRPGAPLPGRRESCTVTRRFAPASEWLYAKLYSGPATTDRVLEQAAPVLRSALSSGVADRWFFIRYGDPEWHLRLRIHGDPEGLTAGTVPLLHRVMAPLLASGEVWRLQLDTYEREVERYGGPQAIEPAEQLFAADSEAALAVVRDLRGDRGAELRWRVALLGIDLLFDDLGLSLEARRGVARRAREGYGREFGAGGAFRREVGLRYRPERTALEALLDPGQRAPADLATSIEALRRRSQVTAPACRTIAALAETGALTTDLPDLAMSLAHMHVNRLLRSAQRAQELVLYEMLDRIYSSRAARRTP